MVVGFGGVFWESLAAGGRECGEEGVAVGKKGSELFEARVVAAEAMEEDEVGSGVWRIEVVLKF